MALPIHRTSATQPCLQSTLENPSDISPLSRSISGIMLEPQTLNSRVFVMDIEKAAKERGLSVQPEHDELERSAGHL